MKMLIKSALGASSVGLVAAVDLTQGPFAGLAWYSGSSKGVGFNGCASCVFDSEAHYCFSEGQCQNMPGKYVAPYDGCNVPGIDLCAPCFPLSGRTCGSNPASECAPCFEEETATKVVSKVAECFETKTCKTFYNNEWHFEGGELCNQGIGCSACLAAVGVGPQQTHPCKSCDWTVVNAALYDTNPDADKKAVCKTVLSDGPGQDLATVCECLASPTNKTLFNQGLSCTPNVLNDEMELMYTTLWLQRALCMAEESEEEFFSEEMTLDGTPSADDLSSFAEAVKSNVMEAMNEELDRSLDTVLPVMLDVTFAAKEEGSSTYVLTVKATNSYVVELYEDEFSGRDGAKMAEEVLELALETVPIIVTVPPTSANTEKFSGASALQLSFATMAATVVAIAL